MICPGCEGAKQVFAHVNYGDGGEYKWINCFRCKGSGEVPDEQAEWIVAGKLLRAKRVGDGRTLKEEAERLGMTASELSAVEHGMRPMLTS